MAARRTGCAFAGSPPPFEAGDFEIVDRECVKVKPGFCDTLLIRATMRLYEVSRLAWDAVLC
jgi:hypothetical protein